MRIELGVAPAGACPEGYDSTISVVARLLGSGRSDACAETIAEGMSVSARIVVVRRMAYVLMEIGPRRCGGGLARYAGAHAHGHTGDEMAAQRITNAVMTDPMMAPVTTPTPARVRYNRVRAEDGLALSAASQTSAMEKLCVYPHPSFSLTCRVAWS